MLNLSKKTYLKYNKGQEELHFVEMKHYIYQRLEEMGYSDNIPDDSVLKMLINTYVTNVFDKCQIENVVKKIFYSYVKNPQMFSKSSLGKDPIRQVLPPGTFKTHYPITFAKA